MESNLKSFLVVDDSKTMQRIIEGVVKKTFSGAEVETADNGLEALKLLNNKEKSFEIILTDWNMPIMNGLALVKKVREMEQFKKIPIIMVTTEGGKTEVITALKAGVNNYIVKPFNSEILSAKLEKFAKEG